jgi:hypothetical protein
MMAAICMLKNQTWDHVNWYYVRSPSIQERLLVQHCYLNFKVNIVSAQVHKNLPCFYVVGLFCVFVLVSGLIVCGRATSNGRLRVKDFRMLQTCMIGCWPCLHKDIQTTSTSKNFHTCSYNSMLLKKKMHYSHRI